MNRIKVSQKLNKSRPTKRNKINMSLKFKKVSKSKKSKRLNYKKQKGGFINLNDLEVQQKHLKKFSDFGLKRFCEKKNETFKPDQNDFPFIAKFGNEGEKKKIMHYIEYGSDHFLLTFEKKIEPYKFCSGFKKSKTESNNCHEIKYKELSETFYCRNPNYFSDHCSDKSAYKHQKSDPIQDFKGGKVEDIENNYYIDKIYHLPKPLLAVGSGIISHGFYNDYHSHGFERILDRIMNVFELKYEDARFFLVIIDKLRESISYLSQVNLLNGTTQKYFEEFEEFEKRQQKETSGEAPNSDEDEVELKLQKNFKKIEFVLRRAREEKKTQSIKEFFESFYNNSYLRNVLAALQTDPFESNRHKLPSKLFSEEELSFGDLLFPEKKPNRYNSEVKITIFLCSQEPLSINMGEVNLILPKFEETEEEIERDLQEITESWCENGPKSTKLKYQIKSSGLKLELK